MAENPRFFDVRRLYFLCFSVSAAVLIAYLVYSVTGDIPVVLRFVLLALAVVPSYAGGRLYLRALRRAGQNPETVPPDGGLTPAERVMIPLFSVYFALYLHLVLTLTLLDPSLGRVTLYAENSREYYLRWYCNFRPFHSIVTVYLENGLGKGLLSASNVLLNLVGNLAAFTPLAFFLPVLFYPMRRWYVFLPTVVLSVAAVEALQFLFLRGSCDVDDLILNASGAAAVYFLLRIPVLSRLVSRFTCGIRR